MVVHMTRSESYIRTSHAGTLPPVAEATAGLARQVAEVVRKQLQIGIDCVGDGEFWNARNFHYYGQQLSGVTSREPGQANGDRGARALGSAMNFRNSMVTWIVSGRCSASPVKSLGIFHRRGEWSLPAPSKAG